MLKPLLCFLMKMKRYFIANDATTLKQNITMSDPQSEIYNAIPTRAYVKLLIELLDLLPVFYAEMAPKDYPGVYYVSLEQAYQHYLRQQIRKFIANDCVIKSEEGKIFITKAEFLKNYTPPDANIELDALVVYTSAIATIFNDFSVVHDGRGNGFELCAHFSDCLYMAVLLTTGIEGFYRKDQVFPEFYDGEVDSKPVFRFIFRYLKSKGLDYHYNDLSKEFRAQLIELSNRYAISSVETRLKATKDQLSTEVIDQLDEVIGYMNNDGIFKLTDIPPVVSAYLDVYGHWPKGYLEHK